MTCSQTIEKLAKLYENSGDIDLVIGLMAESPVPGSLLGPTAICIISKYSFIIIINGK